MTLLTQELLQKKLTKWTLSSKVVEQLGLEESQANEIKQELDALCEMGIVEKEGERRGKKFRFKQSNTSTSSEDEQDSEFSDEVEGEVNNVTDSDTATKITQTASLRAFFADRDLIKSETEGKTPLELMSTLVDIAIKDPSILSHTLSYKKTSEDSVIVTFWSGCVKRYEKEYTLSAFKKVLTSELKALSKPTAA